MADMFFAGIPLEGSGARPLDADLYGAEQQGVDAENISATGNLNIGNVIRYDEHAQRFWNGGVAGDARSDLAALPEMNNNALLSSVATANGVTPNNQTAGNAPDAGAVSYANGASQTPGSTGNFETAAVQPGSSQTVNTTGATSETNGTPAQTSTSQTETTHYTDTSHSGDGSSTTYNTTNTYNSSTANTAYTQENYTQNNYYGGSHTVIVGPHDNTVTITNNGGGGHSGGGDIFNTINNITSNETNSVTTLINQTINNIHSSNDSSILNILNNTLNNITIIDGGGEGSHGGQTGSQCAPPLVGELPQIIDTLLNQTVNITNTLENNGLSSLNTVAGNVINSVDSNLTNIVDKGAGLLQNTLNVVDDSVHTLTGALTGIASTAGTTLDPVLTNTTNLLNNFNVDNIIGSITANGANITNSVTAPVTSVTANITDIANHAIDVTANLTNNGLNLSHDALLNIGNISVGNILSGNTTGLLQNVTVDLPIANNILNGNSLTAIHDITANLPVVNTILDGNGLGVVAGVGDIANTITTNLSSGLNVENLGAIVSTPVTTDISNAVNTVVAVANPVTAPVITALSDITSNPTFADIAHTAQSDLGAVLTAPVATDVSNAVNAVAAAASPAVNTVQAVVSGDTAHVTAPVAATLSDIASNPAVADITHTAQSDIGAVLTTPVTTDVANAVNIVAAATSPVTDTAQAIASGDINPVTAPVTAALGDITSNPTVTDITHTAQSDVSAALTTPVTTDVSNVVNTVAAATNPITDAMQTIASGDTAPVTAPVAAVAGELANTITSDVGALGTVIAPVTSGATETVANTAANALSTASNTADAATTTIIGAAQPVGDTASTTLTSLGNDLHTINTVDIAPPVAATVPVASSLLSNVAAETTNAAATTTTDTHDALTNLASLAHADTAVPPVDAGVLFTGGAAGSLSTSTPAPAATHDTAIDHATHHGLL